MLKIKDKERILKVAKEKQKSHTMEISQVNQLIFQQKYCKLEGSGGCDTFRVERKKKKTTTNNSLPNKIINSHLKEREFLRQTEARGVFH